MGESESERSSGGGVALSCVAAIAKERIDFPEGESGGCDDGGFFGESGEGEEEWLRRLVFAVADFVRWGLERGSR